MLKKLISNVKEFFLIIKNIKQINKDKPKIIFFSENKAYLKYAYVLIDVINKKYPNQIYYVSSDIDDRVKDLNIKNIYIGNGALMQYFFLTVKGDNMFLTLTDLDNMASALGCQTIAVATIPKFGLGLAINDRLKRAAAPRT